MKQTARNIFIVKPSRFGFNSETATTNAFQHKEKSLVNTAHRKALEEFNRFANTLREKEVNVTVFGDTEIPEKPDAVFPNNWITLHENGTAVLYPMQAANRRAERRPEILEALKEIFDLKQCIDLSDHENNNRFLEGTGSVVFDHIHRIAYACLSPRTDLSLFRLLCRKLEYKAVPFHAYGSNGQAVYHTNVMMAIGKKFATVCLDSIADDSERTGVCRQLQKSQRIILDISKSQMCSFAGNMLELENKQGDPLLVLSQTAYDCLNPNQTTLLASCCELVPIAVPTIEAIGGGSVRCMIAEIFLPEKRQ